MPSLPRILLIALAVTAVEAPAVSISYTPDPGLISNPERGFHEQSFAYATEQVPGSAFLPLASDGELLDLAARHITVVHRLYSLLDFRNAASIDAGWLKLLQADFNNARSRGIKLLVRFAYTFNFDGGASMVEVPIARIEGHIAQLGGVLSANADVLTHLDAGLLGRYGEWYSPTDSITQDMRTRVVNGWLAALPADRTLVLRTPDYKRAIFGNAALSQGFNGSASSRVGHHDDCYLASLTDLGTYSGDPAARAEQKQYLRDDNRFVPMSGETCKRFAIEPEFETCGPGEDCVSRDQCPTALAESAQLRWSLLNTRFFEGLVGPAGLWRQPPACHDTFSARLGYRPQLVSAELPTSASCTFAASIRAQNLGFASPYNPRPLYLVFAPTTGAAPTTVLLTDPARPLSDPRRWLPELGTFEIALPTNLPALVPGNYALHLWLPDGRNNLASDPAYSIRLANLGTWDASRGWNALNHTVEISACATLFTNGFE